MAFSTGGNKAKNKLSVAKPRPQRTLLAGDVRPASRVKVNVSDSMKRRLQHGANPTSFSRIWTATGPFPPKK